MDLNERKRKILQAIIDEYIGTAEPVGSRSVSKNKELGLSSATIRNEMADLEELGYLLQPHTSAGRVPSDEGYRFYVNSLMKRYKMGVDAIQQLHMEMENRVNQLDRMIKKASRITSMLTEYTTVVTAPEQNMAKITKIDLVNLGDGRAILIVVTHTGVVRNRMLNLDIDNDACFRLSQILSSSLCGLTADEIDYDKIQSVQNAIRQGINIHPQIMVSILNFVYETIMELDETEIYVDNAKSILTFPEYSDLNKARQMFEFLEDKKNLKSLLKEQNTNDGIEVKIGSENEFEVLKDCSLVTVNYSLDNKIVGKLGVIGPKRMDYAKVFASLDLISNHIDSILNLYGNDKI